MTDCPAASLSSNEFNFAASVRPVKVNASGPPTASAGKIYFVAGEKNFSRAAGGGKNVEIGWQSSARRR